MSTAPAYRKRFTRREATQPIEITERDHAIVRYVHRYRVLRSSHLAQLIPGNYRVLQRRLEALYDHGYLDRPKSQMAYDRFEPGSSHLVYAIGPKARTLLPNGAGDTTLAGYRVNEKNRALKPVFFAHELLLADVMVGVESACSRRSDIDFIPFEEILSRAPEATQRAERPHRLTVDVVHDQQTFRLSNEPDAIFGLRFKKIRGEGKASELFYCLEADRGTEPLARRNPTSTVSNLYKKMLVYWNLYKQDRHKAVLGIDNFRVLTVTTSATRVENLIDVNKFVNPTPADRTAWKAARARKQETTALPKGEGSSLFLFSYQSALRSVIDKGGDVLKLPWRNGKNAKLYRLEE